MEKGDLIALVAQPIARGIDSVFATNLRGCPGCKTMQNNLNLGMSLTDAVIERWFKRKGGDAMQFIVNETITQPYLIEANSVEEAIRLREQGKGETLPSRSINRNAQLKPVAPQPGVPTRPR